MEVIKPTITADTFNAICRQNTISRADIVKLSSITPYTLVEKISNLKNEELKEVYMLEEKNIFKLTNTILIMLGKHSHSETFVQQVLNDGLMWEIRQGILSNNSLSASAKTATTLKMATKYVLAIEEGGNISQTHNGLLKPVFDGKIPKKMFSFRQTDAEEWYENYVNFVVDTAFLILAKGELSTQSLDNAFLFTALNTAYYLNKSQTFKYYRKSTDKDLEDALFRIVTEFTHSQGSDFTTIKNTPTKILYKDL